ncbi:hypothetical protein BCF46_0521 [Litoreibacter meonggei]|uniref:Lipoprotein n=1 Tax=Litoreibacter meonggei TaxID=1049199 RepID=A0A497X5P5_9RHOB|nr:hypothetical protein [Litoreibacter meonggei]RLJ60323.1 hypothetical protein BCF46_0521 [Litoreibacter meonggei]
MKKFSAVAVAGAMTLSACLPAPELSVDDFDLARYASAMAQVGCIDFDGITHAEIRKITGWKDMKLDKVQEEAVAQLQAIEQAGGGIRSTVGACA